MSPILIAHRGASAFAPENTLPAMQLAHQLGALWVEFDVMLSQDGFPFIFHDDTLDRTTLHKGYFCKTSRQEIQQLDAGSWFNAKFHATPIPSLEDMLKYLAQIRMQINLEIKPADHRVELLVEKIVQAVTDYWPHNLEPILYSSFSLAALRILRANCPTAKLGLLLEQWQDNWQDLAEELNVSSIHLHHSLLTPQRVQQIHASGRGVLCYTINNYQQAQEYITMGIDGFFSDYPNLMDNLHGI